MAFQCSVEKVHDFFSNGVLPYSSDGQPWGCGHNMQSFGGLKGFLSKQLPGKSLTLALRVLLNNPWLLGSAYVQILFNIIFEN